MKIFEQIQADIRILPVEQQKLLLDWLENVLEDGLKFTPEFQAKIKRGEEDLREGSIRIRRPEN